MLIEEAQDFATSVLLQCLLVVHNAIGGSQHDEANLSWGQHVAHHSVHLLFCIMGQGEPYLDLDIKSGRVHTALVQAAQEVQHDLLSSPVIHNLELAHVLYFVVSLPHLLFFCMMRRNLITIRLTGLRRTWRLPARSAFTIAFRQFESTSISTIYEGEDRIHTFYSLGIIMITVATG